MLNRAPELFCVLVHHCAHDDDKRERKGKGEQGDSVHRRFSASGERIHQIHVYLICLRLEMYLMVYLFPISSLTLF
jgi:hypothetical protein